MNIQLKWKAEDEYIINKNAPLLSSLHQANNILENQSYKNDYVITDKNFNISPITNETKVIEPNDNKGSNDIVLNIIPTDQTTKEIEGLLLIDQQKEKHYSTIKEDFAKLLSTSLINASNLKKKFTILIRPKSTYYFKLLDNIHDKILCYDKAKREINEIKANMTKFKTSQIINLYYKVSYERNMESFTYLMQNARIFLANKTNHRNLIEAYKGLIRTIINEANNDLNNKMKGNPIYEEHKVDYEEFFNFIETVLELYPILKYTDNKTPKIVFSALDPPITLKQSENQFLIVKNIQTQLPTYDALKTAFHNFKEGDSMRDALEMAFRTDCDIYKRFGSGTISFIYATLLYEEYN